MRSFTTNLKKICDVAISSNFTKGFNNQKDIIKILLLITKKLFEKSHYLKHADSAQVKFVKQL